MDILAMKLTLILTVLINIGFWKIQAFKSYLIATKIKKRVDRSKMGPFRENYQFLEARRLWADPCRQPIWSMLKWT